MKKILFGLLGLLVLIIISLFTIVHLQWDKTYDIAYPALVTRTDSATIAMGKYLANGPAHCVTCHVGSYEDMIRTDKGEINTFQGGVVFPMGPIGFLSPANLTPDKETGIGRYKDGEVFRMMRHAVKPDGTASLALMMPFWNMADEDLEAVVSYLRTLPPIKSEVPPPDYSFVGKAVRVFAPTFDPIYEPTPSKKAPPMEPTVERGEYLARYVANCVGCHTNRDPLTFEPIGPEYAGGMEFEPLEPLNKILGLKPNLWTHSVNLTPHPESALSRFKTLDAWINRFRQGRIIMNSPMHWGPFSRMSDQDLEALWKYFHSLEPVEYDVGPIVFEKK